MLVIMLGFARGLENAVYADFGNWAPNAVFMFGERTSKPYAGRQPNRPVLLTLDDVDAVAGVKGVELVVPRNFYRGSTNISRGERTGPYSVSGDQPDFLKLENLEIKAGRFLNPADVADHRKVAVISERIRKK